VLIGQRFAKSLTEESGGVQQDFHADTELSRPRCAASTSFVRVTRAATRLLAAPPRKTPPNATAVPMPAPAPAAALALPAINEANRVWAGVVGRGGDPVSNLASVYGGRWLETVRGEVEAMRSRGQYRVARLVAPVTLRSATYTSAERIEASTSERWDDRLYNRDGSVARVAPGHVEQRYVLQRVGSGWLIVDSQLERS
jgi:hypothetical protein